MEQKKEKLICRLNSPPNCSCFSSQSISLFFLEPSSPPPNLGLQVCIYTLLTFEDELELDQAEKIKKKKNYFSIFGRRCLAPQCLDCFAASTTMPTVLLIFFFGWASLYLFQVSPRRPVAQMKRSSTPCTFLASVAHTLTSFSLHFSFLSFAFHAYFHDKHFRFISNSKISPFFPNCLNYKENNRNTYIKMLKSAQEQIDNHDLEMLVQ